MAAASCMTVRPAPALVHADRRVHPTAIVEAGVAIGAGTAVWDNVHVRRDARLGDECIVGEKTYIAYGVRIGHRVKINAFVYVCTAVTLEDGVMIARRHGLHQRPLPPGDDAGPPAPAPVRAGRTHPAHPGARGGDDRRRLHDRQRPRDRPLGHGRHGLGGDEVGRPTSSWSSATRPAPVGCVCRCGQLLGALPSRDGERFRGRLRGLRAGAMRRAGGRSGRMASGSRGDRDGRRTASAGASSAAACSG